MMDGIPNARELQITVCRDSIDWAKAEKRVFLKQSLETRLAVLYLANRQYVPRVAGPDGLAAARAQAPRRSPHARRGPHAREPRLPRGQELHQGPRTTP